MGWNPWKDIRKAASSAESKVRHSLADIDRQARENLNDWSEDWIERPLHFGSDLLKGVEDYSKDPGEYISNLLSPDLPPLPEIPNAPTFDQARALAEQNRRKRGKAATILSERPSSPMGYTGGGYVSGAQLLGSA